MVNDDEDDSIFKIDTVLIIVTFFALDDYTNFRFYLAYDSIFSLCETSFFPRQNPARPTAASLQRHLCHIQLEKFLKLFTVNAINNYL